MPKTKMARKKSQKTAPGPHLPDPKNGAGPYRPFASDPGWNEAWWWLWLPVLYAGVVVVAGGLAPDFYDNWIIPEGYGVLEFSQFLIMIAALVIAVRLLFDPFVRARPFVFAVSILAALSSLYIAGEEMSWGQHFFHWNTPEYWANINIDDETNLHKTYDIVDKAPRVTLELGVLIGGLADPAAGHVQTADAREPRRPVPPAVGCHSHRRMRIDFQAARRGAGEASAACF